DEAAVFGEVLFKRDGKPIRAFNVACSSAKAGDVDGAIRWLKKAQKAGFDRVELLDDDSDLAAVRARQEWPALRASFSA
ncbi:MAG: hypothetical protein AAGF12_35885, partial [Myxococcota bacterium]